MKLHMGVAAIAAIIVLSMVGCSVDQRILQNDKFAKVCFVFTEPYNVSLLGGPVKSGQSVLLTSTTNKNIYSGLSTRIDGGLNCRHVQAGTYYVSEYDFGPASKAPGRFGVPRGNIADISFQAGEFVYLGEYQPLFVSLPNVKPSPLGFSEQPTVEDAMTKLRSENPELAPRLVYRPLRGRFIQPLPSEGGTVSPTPAAR